MWWRWGPDGLVCGMILSVLLAGGCRLTSASIPDSGPAPVPQESAGDAAVPEAPVPAPPPTVPAAPSAREAPRIPAAELEGLPRQIEDPGGEAMAHFYGRLRAAALREPGALVRIALYSVSTNAADRVTGTLRRAL